jgi:Zn-dependent protease
MSEKRKFSTSLHDLSPREYMYIPHGTLDVGKPGSFSKIELLHLFIAIGVLTTAFSFTLSGNSLLLGFHGLTSYLAAVPIVFLGLITAFFIHELSHKFMAQKYGLWSEFRMYPFGLGLSFLLAFFTGFVFATPGAVMFRGEARPSETGRIATAGPLSNIIIAVVTYVLYRFVFFEIEFWGTLIGFICLVNALLATFNLLPLGPLDGKKVIQWNSLVWSLLFSISVMFLGGMFIGGVPLPGF